MTILTIVDTLTGNFKYDDDDDDDDDDDNSDDDNIDDHVLW